MEIPKTLVNVPSASLKTDIARRTAAGMPTSIPNMRLVMAGNHVIWVQQEESQIRFISVLPDRHVGRALDVKSSGNIKPGHQIPLRTMERNYTGHRRGRLR